MVTLADLPDEFRAIASEHHVDERHLAEAALAEVRRLAAQPLELLRDDEVARRWEMALGGFYTAQTVGEVLHGVTRQAVSKRRDLLALRTGNGRVVYPRLQFRRGSPAPAMAELLASVPDPVVDRWSLAGWLAAPNRRLDGERPIDAMHDGLEREVLVLATGYAARAVR
jgi:hypothetical protein